MTERRTTNCYGNHTATNERSDISLEQWVQGDGNLVVRLQIMVLKLMEWTVTMSLGKMMMTYLRTKLTLMWRTAWCNIKAKNVNVEEVEMDKDFDMCDPTKDTENLVDIIMQQHQAYVQEMPLPDESVFVAAHREDIPPPTMHTTATRVGRATTRGSRVRKGGRGHG